MPGLCFPLYRGPRLLFFPESAGTFAFSYFKICYSFLQIPQYILSLFPQIPVVFLSE